MEGYCIISSTISQLIFCIIEMRFMGQCLYVACVWQYRWGLFYHGCLRVFRCGKSMLACLCALLVCVSVSGVLTSFPTGGTVPVKGREIDSKGGGWGEKQE